MRLVVTTPTAVVADVADVVHVRAEDDTGAFGIKPGHGDFLTSLPVSVITWSCEGDDDGFVLVRGGILSVHGGNVVEVATRGACSREDLSTLGKDAILELERADELEDVSRTSDTRLHLAAIRQVQRVLEAGRASASPPPSLQPERAQSEP